MDRPSEKKTALAAVFDENLAEFSQAKTRLWMTVGSIIYIVLRWAGSGSIVSFSTEMKILILTLPTATAIHLALFFTGYGIFGLMMLVIIRRYPGHFVSRRLTTMFCDFAALTYTMIIGGNPVMIFYALILWVAVGNGMRFGARYLLIAAILAQLSLVMLVIASPFWWSRIDVIITFSITALALPAYAVVLLRHTAKSRDAAMAAMQAKSRFLAQASHDLRQPIHSIGYYLDILRTTNGKAERNQLLSRIERALGSVSRLFKSLLDIAHLDSGTVEVRSEPVVLQSLLADLVQQNEQNAQWNDVELRFVASSLNVHADPTLLATMVQNLVSNAIKYSRGSKVLIGVRRKGKTLAIEVHDRGIGIDAEHLPNIFDEFYRAHVAGDRDTEGVGLGLAIVDRLAQLSGFVLDLKSRRSVGTIAGIYGIPITTLQVDKKQRTRNGAPQPLAGFRVIFIEDDQDVLEATQALLERWGCIVQAHSGLPTQIDMADIIIADFDLGNQVLGTDVINLVRAELGYAVPAILMTGHTESLVKKKGVNEGIQILAKPVQPAMLRSILSAFRIAGRNQS